MKKILFLLSFCQLLVFCETTKLVYDSRSTEEINRLGIARLNRRSVKLGSILPKLDSNFTAASLKYSTRYLAKDVLLIDEQLSCHEPDSLKITELCLKNKLDAIVLTYVEFRLITNTINFIPVGKYFECVLYTKIYHKSGKMLYSVVHDSKNDSYSEIPDTYDVVALATGITYKKIHTIRQKQ